jgi:hypothetical protein
MLLSVVWLVAFPLPLVLQFIAGPLSAVQVLALEGLMAPPLCMTIICLLPSVRRAMNR